MRTHDDEFAGRANHERVASRRSGPQPPTGPLLGANAMLHLQRTAGNASVAGLLEDEEAAAAQPSPVRQVVGGGGGQPLDPGTQAIMESRLGADFSDVRIHTGTTAAESARSVNARAYTVGHDIVFGTGQYQQGSPMLMRTLAHELTHVVQQRSGAVDGTPAPGGIRISDPSDRFERAAEANAARVMSAPDELETVQTLAVQRQAESEDEESAED